MRRLYGRCGAAVSYGGRELLLAALKTSVYVGETEQYGPVMNPPRSRGRELLLAALKTGVKVGGGR